MEPDERCEEEQRHHPERDPDVSIGASACHGEMMAHGFGFPYVADATRRSYWVA